MTEIIYPQEPYEVMEACFEVYKETGCGFLVDVYQECLEIELQLRGIPFRSQVELPLAYKGRQLESKNKPDFICYDKIISEIKTVTDLANIHRA
jgi:GxxExxY protein